MKQFRLLIYEDDADWVKSFKFNMEPRLMKDGLELLIRHKLDSSTILEDLEYSPNLILVDYDLGTETGKDVIEQMEGDPQLIRTSIFLYSGGETIEFLRIIADKLGGGITCFTKEGDGLQEAVVSKGLAI